MYMTVGGVGPVVVIFYLALVLFGSFFVLNLVLAVLEAQVSPGTRYKALAHALALDLNLISNLVPNLTSNLASNPLIAIPIFPAPFPRSRRQRRRRMRRRRKRPRPLRRQRQLRRRQTLQWWPSVGGLARLLLTWNKPSQWLLPSLGQRCSDRSRSLRASSRR